MPSELDVTVEVPSIKLDWLLGLVHLRDLMVHASFIQHNILVANLACQGTNDDDDHG